MKPRLTPIIVSAPQRSDEWWRARLGNLTASVVAKAMSFSKPTVAQMKQAHEVYAVNLDLVPLNDQKAFAEYIEEMSTNHPAKFCLDAGVEINESAERIKLRQELVGERITGMRADPDGFVTHDMKWGIYNEQYALDTYRENYNVKISPAPLMLHPTLLCGASPDSLAIDLDTGELGNVEVKCLRTANHLYKIVKESEMPDEYFPQVQMQMWIDGRDWSDFIGFDSRVKPGLQIFVIRVPYDEFYVANVLEPLVRDFLQGCDHDERIFYAIMKSNLERKLSQEHGEG